ncbi:hypothetical protein CCACVL1_29792 [Corchorus capsularis]|uniref:Uncharacterized protein n=1 Tax=Corchorus capsularis TaxID=210143 RepID=A0A1R3G065_COCAP|nr:hypothetical protein CCACVL1_29792 [Corchorus capsularis]
MGSPPDQIWIWVKKALLTWPNLSSPKAKGSQPDFDSKREWEKEAEATKENEEADPIESI